MVVSRRGRALCRPNVPRAAPLTWLCRLLTKGKRVSLWKDEACLCQCAEQRLSANNNRKGLNHESPECLSLPE